MLKATTIHLDTELYERLRMYVYSRKMLDPQISNSKVITQALKDFLGDARQGQ